MTSDGFRDLVGRAQAGDVRAADRLLTIARPWLEEHCRSLGVAGPENESDIVQVSALRAWQNLDQFHGAHDDEQTYRMFRGWLGTIVRRVMANDRRDRHRQRRHPGQDVVPLVGPGDGSDARRVDAVADEPTPSTRAQDWEEARLIRAAIEKIPDDIDRRIVHLRFFEALSLRAISQVIGLTYDKTRERYQDSMKLLERELAELL
jgi:RNA polymerase sigma factor (sigma-70 family)